MMTIEKIRGNRVKLLYADGIVRTWLDFHRELPEFINVPELGGGRRVFSLLCESQTGASLYVELLGGGK